MQVKLQIVGLISLLSLKALGFETLHGVNEEEQNNDDKDINHNNVPAFEWDVEYHHLHKGQKERLIIKFKDGGPDDVAILTHSKQIPLSDNGEKVDNCIFSGMFQNEPDVSVSLNGCPLNYTFEVKVKIILKMEMTSNLCSHKSKTLS